MNLRHHRAARGAAVGLAMFAVHCTLVDGDPIGEGGLAVDIAVQAEPAPSEGWRTSDGASIAVERGYVALRAVEILTCQAAEARAPGAWFAGLGVAHAHETSSPRRLGVPAVAPVAPPGPVGATLGTLEPPPGSYCDARVTLGPADGDAVMLPGEVEMVGSTLIVEGQVTAADAAPQPFRLHSTTEREVVVPVRFDLSADGARTTTLAIQLDVGGLFVGVSAADLESGAAAERVLESASQGLRITEP